MPAEVGDVDSLTRGLVIFVVTMPPRHPPCDHNNYATRHHHRTDAPPLCHLDISAWLGGMGGAATPALTTSRAL